MITDVHWPRLLPYAASMRPSSMADDVARQVILTADIRASEIAMTMRWPVGRTASNSNGLFKTEVIRRRGPWRNLEAVEFATLEWVDWFNNRRLLKPIGNIPPAEAEARYYAAQQEIALAA